MKSSSRRPRIHVAKCPGKPRQFARNELRRRPLTQVERHSIYVIGAARNFFFAAHNARRDTCSPPGRPHNRAGPVETVTGLPLRKPRGNPRGDPRKMSMTPWLPDHVFHGFLYRVGDLLDGLLGLPDRLIGLSFVAKLVVAGHGASGFFDSAFHYVCFAAHDSDSFS
jgi:hypothetical protein